MQYKTSHLYTWHIYQDHLSSEQSPGSHACCRHRSTWLCLGKLLRGRTQSRIRFRLWVLKQLSPCRQKLQNITKTVSVKVGKTLFFHGKKDCVKNEEINWSWKNLKYCHSMTYVKENIFHNLRKILWPPCVLLAWQCRRYPRWIWSLRPQKRPQNRLSQSGRPGRHWWPEKFNIYCTAHCASTVQCT